MHDFTVNYEVSGKWFFGMPNYPAKKQVKVFFLGHLLCQTYLASGKVSAVFFKGGISSP